MEKFTTHTGIAVPLRRSNVDTDQIIPAVYLKRITRTGFEDGLFSGWRTDPDFVLNKEPWKQGTILVAGPDFGTGSSREHAVWALQNYGFKVVIGSRFGDIFRSNAGKSGLLIATVSQDVVEQLWVRAEESPNAPFVVDLAARTITAAGVTHAFQIDDHTAHRLSEGLDDIGSTLRHEAAIEAFESTRPDFKPRTLPARVAD
ncbi:3-isopropylmalate dehydratase small subunit [Luteococcus sp. Sow4_B9]|uniref:3-isopropylmalate dehydratase small subunit n=1 Tax=Luteococcus sp. Sow4_B9 TaxID=3438792 RepID=UPI003F944CC8